MMRSCPIVQARLFTALPKEFRHSGEPSRWAQMTRPGQPMHSFIEGAFFDQDRNLWVSDVPYGRVFRISPGGDWDLRYHYDGEPHSMRIAPDGRHIVVDYLHGLRELTGFGTSLMLTNGLDGQPFLGLSDMTYAPDGTLWFTDSGRSHLGDPSGRVYTWHDEKLRLVLDCVPYSNGIAISPDGAWVYVAVTRANQIWRLSARLPEVGQPMVGTFLQLSGGIGPDGLATNDLGWLAIAQAQAGRAYVVTALGDPVAEVRLPQGLWTTSVAFHPDNPRELFITDAQFGSVFSAEIPQLESFPR